MFFSWLQVEHFSRYGLITLDDDDDEGEGVQAGQATPLPSRANGSAHHMDGDMSG